MASINAQSAKFIGNDFIIPARIKKNRETEQKIVAPVAVEAAPGYQPIEPIRTFAAAVPATKESPVSGLLDFIKLRPKLVTLAILLVITAFAAPTIAQAHVWQVIGAKAATIAHSVTTKSHQPVAFSMPAYSKLVATSGLNNDLSYVELQPITITMGGLTVTPQPTDISKWVKSSAGPQAGSTLLSVNTASLMSYIAGIVKNNYSNNSSGGTTGSGVSAAVTKIAKALFSCNGVSVTLPSTST
jgi:hypothetical protein